METILIKPRNKEELQLDSKLMKGMNIKSVVQKEKPKLTKKEQNFLDSLPKRLKEVQDHMDGKIKLKSWDEVYKEL